MKSKLPPLKKIACAAGIVLLMAGSASADLVMNTATKGPGGTFSVNIGGTVTATSAGLGTDFVTMTYTVAGLDLSAEEAGSDSASFDFTVTYSANNGDAIDFSGAGNAGIVNTQVGGNEVLTIAVSNATNVMGFGGTISLDGITSAQLANFNNTSDQQNLLLSNGSNVVLVGPSDTGTAPAGSVAGDTATFAASLGITGFEQSAFDPGNTGSAGFRTLRTQFTAVAAVPEPTSLAMFGFCGLSLLIRRRK